ncbi:MAG: CHASE4 domain-containing protein, partial [Pseudobdellovibrio sp.]
MNINKKINILLTFATAVLLIGYIVFSHVVLMKGYLEAEQDLITRRSATVVATLGAYIDSMESSAADWAARENVAAFIKNQNKKFIKTNLTPTTFKNLDVDVISFFGSDNKPLAEKLVKREDGVPDRYPPSLTSYIQSHPKLLDFEKDTVHTGLATIPEGAVIFAINPIVDGDSKSPAKGSLLFARFLTPALLKKFSDITRQDVTYENLPADPKFLDKFEGTPFYLEITSSTSLNGYCLLTDYFQKPVGYFKSPKERVVYRAGLNAVNKNIFYFAIMLLVFGLLLNYLLKKYVVKRLVSLEQQVRSINAGESDRVTMDRNDEITSLADSMNILLADLQRRNDELQELNLVISDKEAALINSAKMSALGEMAGGIAHEINTPLSVIKLSAEILREDILTKRLYDPDKINRSLLKISHTVDRITKIMKSLRAFSRETDDDKQITDVKTVIADALDLCREKFKNNGVHIVLDVEEDIVLDCRKTEISQVIINLLNNSYDAVEKMPSKLITLEAKKIEGAHFALSVTDTGSGVSEKIRDKIMLPFFTTK